METREQSQIIENSINIALPHEIVSAVAPIINTLVNYEINTGVRNSQYDNENAENNDIIDEVHRSLNIGNTNKDDVILNLTPSEWLNIEQHISEAAKNKAFSPKDLFELESISARINAAFTKDPKTKDKKQESFGMGPNSILYSWGKRRAEKGSRDGLG